MQISSKDFFRNLNVGTRYYTKVLVKKGVKSPYFFDKEDLVLISSLPATRYRNALVVNRAKQLLGGVQ